MDRLLILVGRLIKSMAPTNIFFKVPVVGRFIPLVSVSSWCVESPLEARVSYTRPRSLTGPNGFIMAG